jgi:hypothetical protein
MEKQLEKKCCMFEIIWNKPDKITNENIPLFTKADGTLCFVLKKPKISYYHRISRYILTKKMLSVDVTGY